MDIYDHFTDGSQGLGVEDRFMMFVDDDANVKQSHQILIIFYSYRCGNDYHAPTDCETIKRWLTKCADDSETANYISAHTKDVSHCLGL